MVKKNKNIKSQSHLLISKIHVLYILKLHLKVNSIPVFSSNISKRREGKNYALESNPLRVNLTANSQCLFARRSRYAFVTHCCIVFLKIIPALFPLCKWMFCTQITYRFSRQESGNIPLKRAFILYDVITTFDSKLSAWWIRFSRTGISTRNQIHTRAYTVCIILYMPKIIVGALLMCGY